MNVASGPAGSEQQRPAFWGRGAYELFLESEGIPVHTGVAVDDVRTAQVAPWPRLGAKGAYIRLLGAEDYGSLAAVVSTFVILAVPGSAVQVAVAREIALDLKLDPGCEGMTVTRACASGLQAVTLAAAAIERGAVAVILAAVAALNRLGGVAVMLRPEGMVDREIELANEPNTTGAPGRTSWT